MVLAKQTINVSLTNGIDTKTDAKLVQGPNLLELENAVFTKYGALNKRFGYETLSKNIEGGGELDQSEALGIFDKELNQYTGSRFYSYAPSTDTWIDKGGVVSAIVRDTPIVKNDYDQSNVSLDVNANIACYAWEDSRGGTRYSVIDIQTNTVYAYDIEIAKTTRKPKVVAFDQYLFIFYSNTSDNSLRYQYIPIVQPSTISSAQLFSSDLNAVDNHDEVVNGDKIFVTYYDDTNTTSIRTLDSSFVISAVTIVPDSSQDSLSITSDVDQNVWVVLNDGADLKVAVYNFILAQVLASTVIESVANYQGWGCVKDGVITIWYSQADAVNTQNHLTRINTCTIGGTVGVASDFLRSVYIASEPFVYNEKCYINLIHESEFQSTYFTASEDGNIIAKMSYGTGGVHSDNKKVTKVPQISHSNYIFSHQEKTSLETDSGELFTRSGIYASELDFSSENKFQNAELGQLHIVGGILQSYDGVSVTEHNFNLYPEGITFSTASTGGSMSDGTYSYQVCYEWTDNLGQIHRSSPSLPLQVILSAGTATQAVQLTVPSLRLTEKKDNRAPVRVVVYRTESNGNLYYRVSSISSPTLNFTTVDTISFTDILDDPDIISNDTIYTTGGVLENTAPPSCSLIATYKNRAIVSGLPDRLEFWYSKQRVKGVPVNFSQFLSKRVDAFGGDITAVAVLDSNFLIFKKQAIFLFAGDGPNDLGGGVDYGDPQLITTDAGCETPNSIVITPNGIMFKSTKGIYIITRGLEARYIGDRVEDYNNLTISSSRLVPDTNQVRFTSEEGTTLMYDYFFDQWGVFTNQPAKDSEIWQNRFVYLRSDGEVWKENNTFTDKNLSIPLKITTNWMSLSGVQGFQRIYRMIFLGDYKTAHKLQVAIGYDFNPNFEQFATIDVADVYPVTTYGQNSPYGSDGTSFGYGGAYPIYEFKTHMTKQKCTSVRFQFQDSETHLETFGEAFNMCNIALELGIKGTLRKYSKGNSFATS